MEGLFGTAAGLIILLGTIPAVIDIFRGRFKPNRSSYLMWSVVVLLTLLLQRDLDSGWAMLSTLADCVSCLMIFALSLRYGVGGVSRIDIVCYGIWAIAVALWLGMAEPLAALHLAIIADMAAVVPIIFKIWTHPEQESFWPHATSALAGLLAVAALAQYNYAVLLYPMYIFSINAITVLLIKLFMRPRVFVGADANQD